MKLKYVLHAHKIKLLVKRNRDGINDSFTGPSDRIWYSIGGRLKWLVNLNFSTPFEAYIINKQN